MSHPATFHSLNGALQGLGWFYLTAEVELGLSLALAASFHIFLLGVSSQAVCGTGGAWL